MERRDVLNFFLQKNTKETKQDDTLLNDIAQVKYELDNAYANNSKKIQVFIKIRKKFRITIMQKILYTS